MSGGGFILAINLSLATLVAGVFFFIAAYDRSAAAPRWMTLCYGLGFLYVVLEFAVGFLPGNRFALLVTYMVFALALAAFNIGVARNYQMPVPWRVLGLLLGFALATILVHGGEPRFALVPMLLYQLPYALLQMIGTVILLRVPRKGILDWFMLALLAASAAHFLLKPLIGLALGSIGTSADAYVSTTYAMFSQTISAVLSLAIALATITVMLRDLIRKITAQSETDSLSGLLNRRGFEEHVAPILRNEDGSPLALVLCDLDHFKVINDTYGHAVGDLVIAAFARQLKQSATPKQVAGRIGGEEFAVLLPGMNLPAARLFAENVRTSFSSLAVPGAPPGRSFTASFGIAEQLKGEPLPALLARADAALYRAKTAGRDCVRLAPALVHDEEAPRLHGLGA
jgi:diguanylate cyclase (GGDEF)-like protein